MQQTTGHNWHSQACLSQGPLARHHQQAKSSPPVHSATHYVPLLTSVPQVHTLLGEGSPSAFLGLSVYTSVWVVYTRPVCLHIPQPCETRAVCLQVHAGVYTTVWYTAV